MHYLNERYRQLQSDVATMKETITRCEANPGNPFAYFLAETKINLAVDEMELKSLIAELKRQGKTLDPVTLKWV